MVLLVLQTHFVDFIFQFSELETENAGLEVREFLLRIAKISSGYQTKDQTSFICSSMGRLELKSNDIILSSGAPEQIAPRAAAWIANTFRRECFIHDAAKLRQVLCQPDRKVA